MKKKKKEDNKILLNFLSMIVSTLSFVLIVSLPNICMDDSNSIGI